MDVWPAGLVGFGAAEDLTGHGSGFALTDEQEAEQVHDRVSLGPLEVDVGNHAGDVPRPQENRRNGVGDGRAVDPENPVLTALSAVDEEVGAEFGGVRDR